jgi:L-iditol 2-dehydrogenase/L-idonate 5-dehydrogenase
VILQDVDEEVIKIQNAMGSGIDVSFDCVGYNKTMTTALNATQSGGKVCLIGLALTEMTVPLTPSAARYAISYCQGTRH